VRPSEELTSQQSRQNTLDAHELQAVGGFQMSHLAPKGLQELWPPRKNLIGVPVSCTDYDQAVHSVLTAARERRHALVTAFAAHGVVAASDDPTFRAMISDFALITPDGQAVKLALNFLYRLGMRERVCGPDLLPRLCCAAAEQSVGVYLYGSTKETVSGLRDTLVRYFPTLRVVGCEPSVFRPLGPEEDRELVTRINGSGAGIVFIGLGCPLQERFAHAHRHSIHAVQVCVGAAFDFVAGSKPRAPKWMRDYGWEWLFRLRQEPRRLFRRNAVNSPKFVIRVLLQAAGAKRYEAVELPVSAVHSH
jgi:N-acetylglucosaminyldiphosphoundecaprenol N-acetyl-beta-D-mannosaminyltransferase